jgi:hypothetical protein
MQSRTIALVCSQLALVVLGAPPRLAAQASTMRCESQGGAQTKCSIAANSQVRLARQLSTQECRQGQNWGVGTDYIWVSGGCRAEFTVTVVAAAPPSPRPTPVPLPAPAAGGVTPTAWQLRVCRSEADRRLPDYGFNDIQVAGDRREGSTTYIRWSAGRNSGECAVAPNGRLLEFTTAGASAGAGGVGGGGPVAPPVPPVVTRVTCESKKTDRVECKIPGNAQLRLVRQLSQNPCRINDTYGKGGDYVWVDKGCRGDFEVTVPGTAGAGRAATRRIVCESSGETRATCFAPGATAVRLVRQMSRSACTENVSYGLGGGGIWVSKGCRGEFEVTVPGAARPKTQVQQITCESRSGERAECKLSPRATVTLARQLSTAACRVNDTWGATPTVIWVAKGCRAEFSVETPIEY